jgi:prefoldin subunit 5
MFTPVTVKDKKKILSPIGASSGLDKNAKSACSSMKKKVDLIKQISDKVETEQKIKNKEIIRKEIMERR